MARIFVTHKLVGMDLAKAFANYDLDVWPKRDISRKDLLEKVRGVSAIISMLTERIDAEVMDRAGMSLRVVGNYAVGFDNVDIGAATSRGVVVVNTPGVLVEAVAEHVMALTLAVARRLVEGDRLVRSGKYKGWEPDLLVGMGIRGKTMGIIGLGRIGKWTARLAMGLGMKVIYYCRNRDEECEYELGVKYVGFNNLLQHSDVISLSVPLTDETRKMVGEEQLRLMKPSAIVINTSRGGVLDEDALVRALSHGKLAGAGLDVYENETEVGVKLRSIPNVVLTPHIASATMEARVQMSQLVVDGVKKVLAGKCPENIVNSDVWQKLSRK